MIKKHASFKKYLYLVQKVNYRDTSYIKPIGQIWWESKGFKWPKEIFSILLIILFYSVLSLGTLYENSIEANQDYNLSLQLIGFLVLCILSDTFLEKDSNNEIMRSVFNLLPVSNILIYRYLLLTSLFSYKLYCFAIYIMVLISFNYSMGLHKVPIFAPIVLVVLVFFNYVIFTGAANEIFYKNNKIKFLRSIIIYVIGIPFAYSVMFPKQYDYLNWDLINKFIAENFIALVIILTLNCLLSYFVSIIYFFNRRLS